MRIAWISGWAVPPAWLQAIVREHLPQASHVIERPTQGAAERLARQGPFEWVAGYSLGAQLLLADPETASGLGESIVLFAPILAFPAEAQQGGRVARAQVQYLRRWLRRARPAALTDFYQRAGLDRPVPAHDEAGTDEELQWGLERLETASCPAPGADTWKAYCGDQDALLETRQLAQRWPSLITVPGATHHPDRLVAAFAREVR